MQFQDTFVMKVIAEFLGTALLVILGNGAVANVHLKDSKGFASGWIVIASGYGIGVMVPVMMFHQISAQVNPAVTIGLAAWGRQSRSVVPAFVTAQLLGDRRPAGHCRHPQAVLRPDQETGRHPRHIFHHQLGRQPGQRFCDRVPRHPRPGARRIGDPGPPLVRARAGRGGDRGVTPRMVELWVGDPPGMCRAR
jgi:hypothetical protein